MPSPSSEAALFARCLDLLAAADPAAFALLPQLETSEYAPGWEQLGARLAAMGHAEAASVAFGRAASALEAAERARPTDPRLPFARGQCLRRAGRIEAGIAALVRATTLDPAHAEAWLALGMANQDANRLEPAAAALAAALRLRPGWHEAALNLGVIQQEAGRLDAALDCYALALRSRPDTLARIAQCLVSGRTGRLWLDIDALRRDLLARA